MPHYAIKAFVGGLMLSLLRPPISVVGQPLSLPQPERITDQQGLPQRFIPAILQDKQGFIWMATRDGLCRYDGTRFKVFRPQPGGHPSLSFAGIYTVKTDTHGRLWVLSEQADIDLFEPRTETFTHFSRLPLFRRIFGQYGIKSVYIDVQDRLWIGLLPNEKAVGDGEGLVCFDTRTLRYRWFRHQPDQPHSLSHDLVKDVIQDPKGIIWVATAAGVDRFEPATSQFTHLPPPATAPNAFGNDQLTTLFNGPGGQLLIGSLDGLTVVNAPRSGLRFYPLPRQGADWWGPQFANDPRGGVFLANRSHLFHYRPDQPPKLIDRSNQRLGRCLSLLVDQSGVLWLGTDGKGVDRYDLRAHPFQTALYQNNFQIDLLTRYLKVPVEQASAVGSASFYFFRYTYDGQGKLWVNVGSSTFYQIDLTRHQSRIVPFPVAFKQTETPLVTDERGRVWTIHRQQIWVYETSQQRWIPAPLRTDWNRIGVVLQAVADEQAFWLATRTNGLFRLDRRTGQLRQYRHHTNKPTSLSNDALLCLSADPQDPDRLWIGTFGSGLCVFSKRRGTCQRLTSQQGLPNDVIYSALPDGRGNVWIGTNKGLCRLQTPSFGVRTYTHEDGLLADEFNRFHYLRMPDGQMIMAGLDGFTSFYPNQLTDDPFNPAVELTTLTINNRLVGTDSAMGYRPIQAVDHLDLPYRQNFITLGFAALQYNRPTQNAYRYRLEGLEDNWVETVQPQAVYTDLRAGSYTFWLNASNTSGRWSPYVRKLRITIQPPPWATWWARLSYILFLGALVRYWSRMYLARLQDRQAIQLKQQETEQLRRIDQVKSQFFANITHEFRTPLTLILTPAESLLDELTQTPYRKRLEAISRSGHHLLGLINQLLDLAKLDARALSVDESTGRLSEFVAQQVKAFEEPAQRKGLRLTYHSELTDLYRFDTDKLTKVIVNLVSNAIKFTLPGGHVAVELTAQELIILQVLDTGVGIPADQVNRIFDRFYQVDNPTRRSGEGTGIGLSLVKELVDLQGGHITVSSQEGQGTCFRVELPYQRANRDDEPPLLAEPALTLPNGTDKTTGVVPETASILVVEDNAELAELIVQSLPAYYRICRAEDGQQGLTMARQLVPDLLISDVLMPVLDGIAMCQQLKADLTTNHVPIILLTAKAAHQSRIEGLTAGADDYLTKPFHPAELCLRVGNLLQRQQHLRAYYHRQLTRPEGQPALIEHPFVSRLQGIIIQELDNPKLTVEMLAEHVAMSARSLNRKLSSVAGLTPVELIRTVRLQQAAQLLGQGETVADAAYRVGFESPSYFGQCFKDFFGQTPSEYIHSRARGE